MKPGYKQTEVGVIPVEWEVSNVGREFEIKLGKMLDAEKNLGTPKPYLGNRAVQWDQIDISNLPTVPMSRADIERFRLRKGDLLVCEGGEVGRAAIWEGQLDECYYQKALHRLRPLRGFNSQVMAALLRQWSDKGLLTNYVTQTSIAHLPREKFVEVPMPVPPLPEQRAIASALSDMDALLAALDRLIAKQRDLKQAAMQQLLTGHTRLPGFHGEWVVKRLGDGINLLSGHHVLAQYCNAKGDGIPYLTGPSDFPDRRIQHTKFTTRPTSLCAPNDILVTVKGSGAGTIVLADAIYCISRQLMAIRVGDWDYRFVFYSLFQNSEKFQAASSGLIPGLSRSDLLAHPILLPPTLLEQTAIAVVLTDMDAALSALEQRRDKTRALKQGMMQELLTGRTRLV